MILHIPHSVRTIPAEYRDLFVLSDEELRSESLKLADAYTDELFDYPDTERIIFPFSRFLVDVERFPDDAQEPMAARGMGWCYTHTTDGRTLKRELSSSERQQLKDHYDQHHADLTRAVEQELDEKGHALIIDCHSFPDKALPCELDQTEPRPDFCIGTDRYHTPDELATAAQAFLSDLGYAVAINTPFSGALVPMQYYQSDVRVCSVMIEVNRRLYMDEASGHKAKDFETLLDCMQSLLSSLESI